MEEDGSRIRVANACEVCRKRKRKCDGGRPKCAWCIEKWTDCQYILEKPKKRKHDPAYIADLEAQTEVLKDEVRRLASLSPSLVLPKDTLDILGDSNDVTDDPEGRSSDQGPESQPFVASSSSSAAIRDVGSLIWRLTIEDGGETTFTGPSGNFCFPQTYPGVHHRGRENTVTSPSSRQMELLGPDRDDNEATKNLVGLFEQFINPVHQFVSRDCLETIYDGPTPNVRFLKCAILAAGALFSEKAEARAYGEEMADRADAAALQLCRRHPSVECVQALCILAWRELSLDNQNMAWMYNGMAASMALHLGLAAISLQSLDEAAAGNTARQRVAGSQSLRLRALWSTLLFDRVATSLLGRNCMIPWKRVQAPPFLFAVGPNPSMDELVFDHHSRLWFIHDQYMDRIYSFEFNDLKVDERFKILLEGRDRLLAFYRHMDSRVQLQRVISSPSIIFLHMTYNMSQILIHRPYLTEPAESNPHRLAMRSSSVAAVAIVRLIRSYEKLASFDKAPLFVVHSVQTAAVTLLLWATSTQPTTRNQSIHRLRVCVRALEAMGTRWPNAKRGILMLQQLAQRWHIVIALPMHLSSPINSKPPEGSESENYCAGDWGGGFEAVQLTETADITDWDFVVPPGFFDVILPDISTSSSAGFIGIDETGAVPQGYSVEDFGMYQLAEWAL